MIIIYHLISITLALLIDRIIGDPPNWPHPVKWMGNVIHFLDERLNQGRHKKLAGIFLVVSVIFIALFITILICWAAYSLHFAVGIVAEAIIIATTIAQKDLADAAARVYTPLVKGDLQEARFAVSMIVGRDTTSLDEEGVTRAAVETVAESIGDGITAPLFWALIGGAPLAIVYRAVNTCDSMVGYQNEKYKEFGWAAAKLDDVLNWIPSRLTGWLMMVTKPVPEMERRAAWKRWRQDAKKHASPNSGWLEAAVALFLRVQLGGTNYYQGIPSERAYMGVHKKKLDKEDILHSISIMRHAVTVFVVFIWIGGMAIATALTWL